MDPHPAAPYAPERELALVQVMAEPSLSRAEMGDLPGFIDACLAAGRERASCWRGRDPQDVLMGLGYVVSRIAGASPGSRAGFHLCAMTRAGTACGGTVELYVDEVATKRRSLLAFGVILEEEELCRLHLAHEFYHALEFSRGPMTPDVTPQVRVCGILGMRYRRPACASEIAAHAFARCMTGLSISPQLVDAIALMGEGALSQRAFLSQVERAREVLGSQVVCR
ncbi:hypothetical protein [Olsenella sp. Marseille-P4559]|uniref:hypothetical protein n=1 Tax=Olsenella sp. Marseille-P4559 TaxID=2364795 RepID=UPI00103159C9|nr:hypothetical protein [Olsenella sp. Marseille-P4559]